MQRFLSRITVFVIIAVVSVLTVHAQEPTSIDPALNNWGKNQIR